MKAVQLLACLCLLVGFGPSAAAAEGERPPLWGHGRSWRPIDVPGARCGDGRPYQIFLSAGNPRKIAFDVMGGGACWNAVTCYGLPDTWVHPIPTVVEPGGFLSVDPARSPVTEHTVVYFPYCTGDVHLGRHVAHYAPKIPFHHTGADNFEKAFALLRERKEIDLEGASQFVMMGYSAGALGSLFHVLGIAPHLKHVPDKVLIADAPGLHFGKGFWKKFTPQQLADFTQAASVLQMPIVQDDGDLSSLVPRVCQALPDWRVGVLQGSRDIVMSAMFGAISPREHERRVYSERGLYGLTQDPGDNCSAWVPRSSMHTFLVTDTTAAIRASTGETAIDYIRGLVNAAWGRGSAGPNFK